MQSTCAYSERPAPTVGTKVSLPPSEDGKFVADGITSV